MLKLEVIVQSVADAVAAAEGGADRLEVVRAIECGGLTPSLPIVREIAAATSLPLRTMVRQNAGFATSRDEIRILRREAAAFAALGVDGIVAGFAGDGILRLDDLSEILVDAPQVRVTFHRAFEIATDQMNAVDALARFAAVDSILTSGGEGDAMSRCARLKALTARASGRLRIVAGGGVDAALFAALARSKCVSDVHVGRLAREQFDRTARVSAARVRELRAILDGA